MARGFSKAFDTPTPSKLSEQVGPQPKVRNAIMSSLNYDRVDPRERKNTSLVVQAKHTQAHSFQQYVVHVHILYQHVATSPTRAIGEDGGPTRKRTAPWSRRVCQLWIGSFQSPVGGGIPPFSSRLLSGSQPHQPKRWTPNGRTALHPHNYSSRTLCKHTVRISYIHTYIYIYIYIYIYPCMVSALIAMATTVRIRGILIKLESQSLPSSSSWLALLL